MPTTSSTTPTTTTTPAPSSTTTLQPLSTDPTTSTPAEAERVRLHITPFTPALFATFVPPALQPRVAHVSYHAVQTFPEVGFGFVDMPPADAARLRRKLHGTTLKGHKVRVEEARPEKRKLVAAEAAKEGETPENAGEGVKKRKSTRKVVRENVAEGVELPDGRKVKRGWTEPAGATRDEKKRGKAKKDGKEKKATKSLYTTQPEMLFKTTVPPNKRSNTEASEKKDKKKARKASRETVVHEFEKTRKQPSFLKSNHDRSVRAPAEYVEGKGWVDEDGNVVEAETKRKLRAHRPQDGASKKATTDPPVVAEDSKSKKAKSKPKEPSPEAEESSDAASSAESSSESEEEEDSEPGSDSDSSAESNDGAAVPSPSPTKRTNGMPAVSTPPTEVHPLEALFKRPKPAEGTPTGTPVAPPKLDTSFSFFNSDDVGGDEAAGDGQGETESKSITSSRRKPTLQIEPHTPYTRQDMRMRGIRSAAPTPDTAAIGKRFHFPWSKDDDDDIEEEEAEDDEAEHGAAASSTGGTPAPKRVKLDEANAGEKGEGKDESEFAKWFWEHRGDNNRAWKKRRRDAMKVTRQRENRRVGRKLV